MANEAELGALIIKISTDVSDIKKGLDKAKSDVGAFQKSVTSAFKLIGSAIAVNEIVQFGKRIVDLGDQLNALSIKTGMAASDIAGLRFAAGQSDTSIEAIAQNIRVLSKNMDDAARGNDNAKEAFKRFHIEYQNADGTLRNSRDVLLEVADRLHNTTDKATALAAAQQLLGRSAMETFAFFDQGSEKIRELTDRYYELGATREDIDKFSKQADQFKDQWDEVTKSFEILGIKVMSELLPVFQDLAKELIDKDWKKFADFIEGLLVAIKETAAEVGKLVGWFQTMGALVSGSTFGEAYGKNPAPDKNMILQGEDLGKIAANRKQIIDNVYGGVDPGAGTITSAPGDQAAGAAGPAASTQGVDAASKVKETQNALEKLRESWKDINKQITDSLASTLTMITEGWGSAIADVIVDGKDFGQAMQELWKDIAKTIISEIAKIIAQQIILFTWQTLTGTTGSGSSIFGGLFGKKHREGAVYARNGMMYGAEGFATTGHMGEAGIPAVVHPGEIIAPIDKFFDAVKNSGGNSFNITVNGNQDPQALAQLLAIEIERQKRGV